MNTTAGRNRNNEHGGGPLVTELTSVRFASLARRLNEASRGLGLACPGFRSPPKRPGCRRTIRWERDGSATVSVALRGRPTIAVVADMVDGVVAAGRLRGRDAAVARDALWAAMAEQLEGERDDGSGHVPDRSAA